MKFKCNTCEPYETPCVLWVLGDSILPVHCPYEADNEPEWYEIEEESDGTR